MHLSWEKSILSVCALHSCVSCILDQDWPETNCNVCKENPIFEWRGTLNQKHTQGVAMNNWSGNYQNVLPDSFIPLLSLWWLTNNIIKGLLQVSNYILHSEVMLSTSAYYEGLQVVIVDLSANTKNVNVCNRIKSSLIIVESRHRNTLKLNSIQLSTDQIETHQDSLLGVERAL